MTTTDFWPARAAAAATALARLPVEAQAMVPRPSRRAALCATATTRSLNECVGLPLSSLTHSVPVMPSARARLSARTRRVRPGLRLGSSPAYAATGQQARVAPDVLRTGLDALARHVDEVVADLEGAEALDARVGRTEAVGGAALATGETRGRAEVGHGRCSVEIRGGGDVGRRHGEAFLLIFPSGRSTGRTELAPSPRPRAAALDAAHEVPDGCRGFIGPYPSAPLDERCSVVPGPAASTLTTGGEPSVVQ